MANYDIFGALEYYNDRANVIDSSTSKRAPVRQWQNFFQSPQAIAADTSVTGDYSYLAFDVDGFGSTEAGSISNLRVSLAATADLVDLTDQAMAATAEKLIIASLYIQTAGGDVISGSATLVSRYIGVINAASVSDETIEWTVNPAINKLKAQIPSRKITSNILGRFEGQ
jgi:hypothetical protein